LSKVTGAAVRTTVLNDHGKHNPIAEVADFLRPELQLLVVANQSSRKLRMAARPSKWSPNALPSKVASSAKLLATASRSRRFVASNALPMSATGSGVVASSVIRQPIIRVCP